ncbi:unnamed protein product [Caenorhabditis brenneri]
MRTFLFFVQVLMFQNVCGHVTTVKSGKGYVEDNGIRTYGEVRMVAPIGNFLYDGHVYGYYNLPRFALLSSSGLISVNNCEKLGNHFQCQPHTSACNINNYTNCGMLLKKTPNNIFSTELGDSTFIATTLPYYELFRNKSSEGEYQDVPRSGHFLFQAPRNYFIQFNTQPVQKFYGRHSEFVLKIIKATEIYHELNHAKIDEANENSKAIGTHLNDEELHTLHGHYGYFVDSDTLLHLFKWKPVLMYSLTFILVSSSFALIVSLLVFCYHFFHREQKKGCNKKLAFSESEILGFQCIN